MTPGDLEGRIDEDGWAVVAEVLDPSTVTAASEALDRLLDDESDIAADRGWATTGHRVCYALPAKDPLFLDIVTSPEVLRVAEAVLGDDCVLAAANGIDLVSGGTAQELHRDHPDPIDGATVFLHVVCALDPFTSDNGGTRLVTASHRGPWRRGDDPVGPVRSAEVPAGGAVVYDGTLVHGAGSNATSAPRRALHLFYSRWWARPHWDFPAMLSPEQIEGRSERDRKVLGFDDRPRRFDPVERVVRR